MFAWHAGTHIAGVPPSNWLPKLPIPGNKMNFLEGPDLSRFQGEVAVVKLFLTSSELTGLIARR